MRGVLRGILAVVCAVIGSAPVAAQGLVGVCFDVEHGEWSPALELGEDSIYLGLPSRVRFDEEAARGRASSDAFSLEVAPGALPSVHEIRQWSTSGDSIDVVWSNGFSGVRGSFRRAEGTLHGMVRSFWDFGRTSQSAPARLIPVACDTPHDPERGTQRFVPRVVDLSDGRRLQLGAPISEISGLESGRGRLSRYIRGAEVFGVPNVPEIRLTPTENGLVRLLVIRFPVELDFDGLVTSLVEALGPGAGGELSATETLEYWSLGWQNRTTRLVLSKSRRPGDEWYYSLMLSDPSMPRF